MSGCGGLLNQLEELGVAKRSFFPRSQLSNRRDELVDELRRDIADVELAELDAIDLFWPVGV